MSDEPPFIAVSRPRPRVAELTLNRPDRRNVLSLESLDELSTRLAEVATDEDIHAVVLSAEGPSFCAGADLKRVHNPELGSQSQLGLGAATTWEVLESVPVPVVAAVQGHAVGGGFHLAICCDLIVAADDAIFRDAHAALGLVPGSGEAQRILRRLGLFHTRELLFTSRALSASKALEWGIVTEVVPAATLREAARDLAEEIAGNNRRTLGFLKTMVNRGAQMSYGEARWADAILTKHGRVNREPDPDRDARLAAIRNRSKA